MSRAVHRARLASNRGRPTPSIIRATICSPHSLIRSISPTITANRRSLSPPSSSSPRSKPPHHEEFGVHPVENGHLVEDLEEPPSSDPGTPPAATKELEEEGRRQPVND